jgi:nicotinate-nucleotide adenylyltransferase
MGERTLGIGVIGGTFNPVHLGHLRAAEEVGQSLQLRQIIFIPSANPPHKGEKGIVSFAHRWRMLELAVGGNPLFSLSDLEYQRAGKSYSVETLTELSNQYSGDEELYFILGADAFLELPTWKSYRELFTLCHFVVVSRPGFQPESLFAMLKTNVSRNYTYDSTLQGYVQPDYNIVYYREITLLDISSTHIRKLLATGRSVRYLVPESVEQYIQQYSLYQ